MTKNILVAVDDSENAMRAVKALADSFTTDHKITLFSVLTDTAAVCDLHSPELIPHFVSQKATFCALEDQKKALMQEAQQRAQALLVKAGFDENNITLKIDISKQGVARDILNEAKSGYSTIVLGRRGLSLIKEFFLGSVPQKVLSSAKDISIFLVD
jgi:nucleotide-binding universal stress UspA family protein